MSRNAITSPAGNSGVRPARRSNRVAATRLRKGSTNSARGAARLVADALVTAARAGVDPGAGSLVILRADSAYYNHDVIAAAIGHGARFSPHRPPGSRRAARDRGDP